MLNFDLGIEAGKPDSCIIVSGVALPEPKRKRYQKWTGATLSKCTVPSGDQAKAKTLNNWSGLFTPMEIGTVSKRDHDAICYVTGTRKLKLTLFYIPYFPLSGHKISTSDPSETCGTA